MTRTTPKRLPAHLPPMRKLSTSKALFISKQVIAQADSPVMRKVFAADAARPGKTRKVSLETFLQLALAYKRTHLRDPFLLADVTRWAEDFTAAQRSKIGLADDWNYDNLQTALKGLCRLIADPEYRTTPRRPGLPSTHEFVNALIASSIPAGVTLPSVLAMDSTDIPTHARRRSWLAVADVEEGHLPVENARRDKPWNEPGWPRRAPDGRAIPTVDPDARLGYRSELGGSGIFCGYDGHTLVDAGNRRGVVVPHLIRGVFVAPAGSYKAPAGIALVDSLRDSLAGHILTSDRGYTFARAESWAYKLQDRGIDYVHDLHAKQRGERSSELAGTVWIDGTLFVNALPQKYRALPIFVRGMSVADRMALIELYDERAQWAFTNNSKLAHGAVQVKGPARTGHVRCRNYPQSMRAKAHVPITTCVTGSSCACGSTRVIKRAEQARERQLHPFGTRDWADFYGMRNSVESGNSQLKIWRGSLGRHSTYVMGATATTVVFALHCAAINLSLIEDAYDGEVTHATRTREHVPPVKRRRTARTPAMHRRPASGRQRTTA